MSVYKELMVLKIFSFKDPEFLKRPVFTWETTFIAVTILIGLAESLVLAHHHTASDGWRSIYDVDGFGEFVRSLRERGEYRDCYGNDNGFWDNFWGHVCFSASRMPFNPFFLAGLSFVSLKPIIVLVLKNIVFFLISAFAFVQARRMFVTPWPVVVISAIIFYLNPLNARVAAAVDYEEGYIYHLLPWLFIILATQHRRGWEIMVLSLVLFALVLVKSSMLYLCIACVCLMAVLERQHILQVLPPLCCLTLAIVGWGTFTLHTSGRFAFGSDMSSNNGWNLYKGNNPHTADYYPETLLDNLDYDGITKLSGEYNNEWQINDRYKDLAIEFMKNNHVQTARNILSRLYVIFLSTVDMPLQKNRTPNFSPSILLLHIIVSLSLVIVVATFTDKRAKPELRRMSAVYTVMLLAYVAPYVAGFAYPKHAAPTSAIALFFIMSTWGVWSRDEPGSVFPHNARASLV
jgi:hypothetical protein